METEVSILWVDNAPDYAVSIAQKLGDWLDEKGLELKPVIRTDSSTVLNDIKENDFELIIIDYLLTGETGDNLIDKIRQNKYFQDIVFYTGGPIEPLYQKPRDGVFYVAKNFAETRIQQLMELKLWRLADPASVRGWVVADAIELESMVTDLLSQCYATREGFTFSERFLYNQNSPIDFGRKADIFNGILGDLIKWLNAQPNKDQLRIDKLNACKSVFDKFKDEVVEVRNAVAHQRVEETEAGKTIKKKTKKADPILLDDANLASIRNNLRRQYKNLLGLQSIL